MSESRHDDSRARRVDSLRGPALGWTGALQLSAHGAALVCCGLVLVAVGQPIFSDDLWWHLALGAAYLREGPWLAADPLLFTALAAPPPTSFLADAGLHLVWALSGFRGLRFFHLTLVIAILGLAWSCLRGAGRNRAAASVLTAVFAAFSAYRLVQLRPELGTVLATLLLYQLLLLGPAHFRIAVKSAVILQPGNASDLLRFKVRGVTGDVSEGGCSILFPLSPRVGDIYRLQFDKAALDIPLTFTRCVRCRLIREDAYEAGFAFFNDITLPEQSAVASSIASPPSS